MEHKTKGSKPSKENYEEHEADRWLGLEMITRDPRKRSSISRTWKKPRKGKVVLSNKASDPKWLWRLVHYDMAGSHYTWLSRVTWSKCSSLHKVPSKRIRWGESLHYPIGSTSKIVHLQINGFHTPDSPFSRVLPWSGWSQDKEEWDIYWWNV